MRHQALGGPAKDLPGVAAGALAPDALGDARGDGRVQQLDGSEQALHVLLRKDAGVAWDTLPEREGTVALADDEAVRAEHDLDEQRLPEQAEALIGARGRRLAHAGQRHLHVLERGAMHRRIVARLVGPAQVLLDRERVAGIDGARAGRVHGGLEMDLAALQRTAHAVARGLVLGQP